MSVGDLSEDERREIFRLLIIAEGRDEVRKMIVDIHGLTEEEVSAIEQEGLTAGWSPTQ
jgi:hypothetical protein